MARDTFKSHTQVQKQEEPDDIVVRSKESDTTKLHRLDKALIGEASAWIN